VLLFCRIYAQRNGIHWDIQMGSYKAPATIPRGSPIDAHVGQRIADIRAASGLSTSDLSQRLGVSEEDLHAWEMGTQRVPPLHLMTITKVLASPLSEFFKGLVSDDYRNLGVIIV
jgi:DNA-binding XRE family transcriptional regulator